MKRHCGKKEYSLIFLLLGIFLLVPTIQAPAQEAIFFECQPIQYIGVMESCTSPVLSPTYLEF